MAFLRRFYAGAGTTTTLATGMLFTDLTFTIGAATGWPGTPGVNFYVVIDRGNPTEEKILCTQNVGTTVTAAGRGGIYGDGTSAVGHSVGASVSLCASSVDFDEANQITNLLGNLSSGQFAIGAGAGIIPTAVSLANGYGVTGNTGLTPTPAVRLTHAEGNIVADVALPANADTTFLTTASLDIGTWLVYIGATVVVADVSHELGIHMAVGSATATFAGMLSTAGKGSIDEQCLTIQCIVTVTAPGTLIGVATLLGGATIGTVKATTIDIVLTKATGYTAVRIA